MGEAEVNFQQRGIPGGRGITEDKERGVVSSNVTNYISLTTRCHGL